MKFSTIYQEKQLEMKKNEISDDIHLSVVIKGNYN